MVAIKSKILFLLICFVEAIWLLAAQVIGNTYLTVLCLACFLLLVAWASTKGMVMPVLLFFLPFTPLLKIRPGTISFFSIALIVVYLIYIMMGSRRISIYHLVPAFLLIGLILVVKTLYDYPIANSFVLFSASLLLIPFLARELDDQYDFYWLTVYFVIGITVAAITAQILDIFPTILQYIAKHSFAGGMRHAGYYGDPNFYSAHINAALGGVIVLLLNNAKKSRMIILSLMGIVLLYCGFLSVSKSFLVILVSVVLLLLIEFLFNKGRLSTKFMILTSFVISIIFVLSSTLFSDLIDMMIARLSSGRNFADFTTGRTELWVRYLHAFEEDPLLLFFGQGFTNVLINDRSTHNTILQIVYQVGIVGGVLLLAWMICHFRTMLSGVKIRINHITQIFILTIAAVGPWLGLDYLFFDEFFLIPIYLCVGIKMLAGTGDSRMVLAE